MGFFKTHIKQYIIWKQTKETFANHRKDCQPLPSGAGGSVDVRQGWHNWDMDGDNQDFKNRKDIRNCGDIGRRLVHAKVHAQFWALTKIVFEQQHVHARNGLKREDKDKT